MKFTAIYIHIPFCLRKCNYCDFTSFPIAEGNYDDLANYSQILLKEIELWQQNGADFSQIKSIYLGGGTPSLLDAQEVKPIIDQLIGQKTGDREITLEANPETLSPKKLQKYLAAGINRLSLGVQTFNRQHLQNLGRKHTVDQVFFSVDAAKNAGFTNISIDLIYGLPEQTIEDWKYDIEQALSLNTQHISLYGLSLSSASPWGKEYYQGKLALPDSDLSAEMLEYAIANLQKQGFKHYEIANFSQKGYHSRHNIAYWQRENYLGLGAAASSCYLEKRWTNHHTLAEYQKLIISDKLALTNEENLPIEMVIGEAIFLGLRMVDGIDLEKFQAQYGIDPVKRYRRQIAKMADFGLLHIDENNLRLTEKGLLLGNEVFREFV